MAITVTTPAESTKLTTLATVKAELDITDSSTDTIINNMIDEVSELITGYLDRVLAKETVEETLPSYGGFNLTLSRYPIVSISEIKLLDDSTGTSGQVVTTADYVITEPDSAIVYNRCKWVNTTREQLGAGLLTNYESLEYLYKVTYEAGFVLPSFTSGTRNLPFDIERAAIELVKGTFLSRKRDKSIQTEQVPDVYSVTYSDKSGGLGTTVDNIGGMPVGIAKILNKYRRINIGAK